MKNKAQNFLVILTLIFVGCSLFAKDPVNGFSVADVDLTTADQVKQDDVVHDCLVENVETGEKLEQINPLVTFEEQVGKALSDKNILKKFKQKINDLQVEEVLHRLTNMNKVESLKQQIDKTEVELLQKELKEVKKKLGNHDKKDELYITMFLRACVLKPLKDLAGCTWGITKNTTVSYIVAIVILSVVAEVLPIGPGEFFGYFDVNMWRVLFTGFYTIPVGFMQMVFGALFGVVITPDVPVCDPWINLFSFGYLCP